jgi:hypothetical protein
MKKSVILFIGVLMMGLTSLAQDRVNLVVFSEDGDAFFVYINGVKQNNQALANVKVTDVTPNVSLRIEFENKAYPQLKQNMPLNPGYEHTFRIKKDSKQQLKLRYFGQVALAEATSGPATVQYHIADPNDAGATEGNYNPNMNVNTTTNSTKVNTNMNGGMNTNVNTTVSTQRTTKSNDDVSINVNVGGMGINMNVNGMGINTNSGMNTTTSTTMTSSSSSSSSGNFNNKQNTNTSSNTTTAPSKAGCTMAMSQASFDKMKASVEAKPFSDTKMSTAKLATKNACVSVNQVKEICKLFSMDEDKLAYAKYAYAYCINKSEYYQVSEIFSFSSTTDDFNKFLEQQ